MAFMIQRKTVHISVSSYQHIKLLMYILAAIIILCGFWLMVLSTTTVSQVDPDKFSLAQDPRYITYDVNHGEGMNLRRDVFLRVANVIRLLREKGLNYILVLPPWGGLYHWRRPQTKIPWSDLFDVPSINRFVPAIEFEQFMVNTGRPVIEHTIYLQRYAEGWTPENWSHKTDKRPCIEGDTYYKEDSKGWRGWYFGYNEVVSKSFECVSIQGVSSTLAEMIARNYSQKESLFLERCDTILHDNFGDSNYWKARRAMRYAENLVQIGNKFRKDHLNSDDQRDRTVLDSDWTKVEKTPGEAIGGSYLCVHWRRRDFTRSHVEEIPTINGTAQQINTLLVRHKLTTVFISTDAPQSEIDQLKGLLPVDFTLKNFKPEEHADLSDAAISIVDQWICSHARYFVGSYVSTFTFRIHEDREILGFDPETTFNRMCPDGKAECEQPAKWKINYKDPELTF